MSEKSLFDRRKFLVRLSIIAGAVPVAIVSVPVLGALFGPLLKKQSKAWRKVADISDMPLMSTKLITYEDANPVPWAGVTAKSAAWVRRESEEKVIAFSANCTHLGCPVRWEDQAELFMCPCHGGVYYKDGTVAAGPPPRPLTQLEVRINRGAIEIKTAPVPITTIGNS